MNPVFVDKPGFNYHQSTQVKAPMAEHSSIVPVRTFEEYKDRHAPAWQLERTEDGIMTAKWWTEGEEMLYGTGAHRGWGQLLQDVYQDPDAELLILGGYGNSLSQNILHILIRDLRCLLLSKVHPIQGVIIAGIDLLGRQAAVVGVVGRKQEPVRAEGAQELVRSFDTVGADIVGEDGRKVHMAPEGQQMLPLKRAHVADDQLQLGVCLDDLGDSLCRGNVIVRVGVGVDGDRKLPLLGKVENRPIIVAVDGHAGIVWVELDTVQSVVGHGAAKSVHRLCRRVPDVHIGKGVERILLFQLIEIFVYRVDGELHGHQIGVVQGHYNGLFDVVCGHDAQIVVYIGVGPHVGRVRIGLVYRVGQNVDVGVNFFECIPICKCHFDSSLYT